MSSVPGIACHAVTMTIATHARSGLARMLSLSQPMPSACPSAGSELENRKLKTKAMTMPEITIGMTKIVRSPVFSADAGGQADREQERDDVDDHHRDRGEAEGEQVALQDRRIAEDRDVVDEPDELPVAEADRVREAEEDADDRRQRDREREEDQARQQEEVVDPLDLAPRHAERCRRAAALA